jgi:hypothetical protein
LVTDGESQFLDVVTSPRLARVGTILFTANISYFADSKPKRLRLIVPLNVMS